MLRRHLFVGYSLGSLFFSIYFSLFSITFTHTHTRVVLYISGGLPEICIDVHCYGVKTEIAVILRLLNHLERVHVKLGHDRRHSEMFFEDILQVRERKIQKKLSMSILTTPIPAMENLGLTWNSWRNPRSVFECSHKMTEVPVRENYIY